MPTKRSSFRRTSLGDDSKPTTPRKRVKMVSNELGRKLEEGTVRTSRRMKYKKLGLKLDDEEIVPLPKRPRREYTQEERKSAASEKMELPKIFRSKYLTPKLLAEFALWDYNKKNGTDLEYVRLFKDNQTHHTIGPGFDVNFVERKYGWKHINFEARLRNNADPKPIHLFAELYKFDDKYILTTLSLVKPTDDVHGCRCCWYWSCLSHPPHGFRAGFDTKVPWEPKELSKQEADKLAEFAIHDHNKKQGSDLEFVRTLEYNSFTCAGVVIDFSKKIAKWVHMNFEARVVGPNEVVHGLFAELYLGDDDKYVLATLSVAEPSDTTMYGNWKERINIERGCLYCPESIRHPWRGFTFAYNYPPKEEEKSSRHHPLPFSRSERSLGDDSKPTTPRKREKMVSNELGRKLEEGTVRTSLRMKYKKLGLKLDDEEILPLPKRKYTEEARKRAAFKKMWRPPAHLRSSYLTPKLLAEFALWDYNKKNGTDLEFVGLLGNKHINYGPGFDVNFVESRFSWKHINFEARLPNNADPNPFLLFAELYEYDKYTLTALSLVNPTDDEQGCPRCWSSVSHPPHGFRAGFDTKAACEPKKLSEQEADKLAEFAIHDHNEKQGSDLEFVRTLGCNSFTCAGIVMDFSKKNASWVHMNFEARVVDPKEVVIGLFAELYLGDDDKYVLATLSVAEPSDKTSYGNWKERINIERGCLNCPESIRHPWRGFNFAYNYPPVKKPPVAKSSSKARAYLSTHEEAKVQ